MEKILTKKKQNVFSTFLGDVSNLTPSFRSLLQTNADFPPIPKPHENDWLSEHEEEGQSFDEYVISNPNKVSMHRNVIYILPLGEFTDLSIKTLHDYVGRFFQTTTIVRPAYNLSNTDFSPRINQQTFNKQILTKDILAFLPTVLPADAYCLIAVTMVDLYPEPAWNFVFGMATLNARVGVFSLARYSWDLFSNWSDTGKEHNAQRILMRACKVVTHETGHMFGMKHCIHFSCLMNGCNSVPELDESPLYLCPVCLRKLSYSVSMDPLKRYTELLEFYTERGHAEWAGVKGWTERQLARVSVKGSIERLLVRVGVKRGIKRQLTRVFDALVKSKKKKSKKDSARTCIIILLLFLVPLFFCLFFLVYLWKHI